MSNENKVTSDKLEDLQYKLIDIANKNAELNTRNAELYQYISQLENDYAKGSASIESIIKEKERLDHFCRPARSQELWHPDRYQLFARKPDP